MSGGRHRQYVLSTHGVAGGQWLRRKFPGRRWLDVAWHVDPAQAESHVGRLHVVVANEPGSLGSLSTVIGKSEGNITNLKITNRSVDFFEMMIDVEVKDVRHLTNIIAALRATPAINTVERARG
jgi:guanosine-3',5'-bis(diphosphate) 3'-pyrophosphohydrolase